MSEHKWQRRVGPDGETIWEMDGSGNIISVLVTDASREMLFYAPGKMTNAVMFYDMPLDFMKDIAEDILRQYRQVMQDRITVSVEQGESECGGAAYTVAEDWRGPYLRESPKELKAGDTVWFVCERSINPDGTVAYAVRHAFRKEEQARKWANTLKPWRPAERG